MFYEVGFDFQATLQIEQELIVDAFHVLMIHYWMEAMKWY